ncbi:endonuclease NucS domain-containing protein [Ornithinibacillus halotolerans]|uniref:DUF91 domain-containing protein n=1 Tax=Ornithinibacillus halotolerans TaxID=1274357 RepID=A0A916WF29_9BACI|nr:endonuclease NucS domain-containing protein [Ornithinibacillus halotolerans]GGA91725.1 hypothetical protein GCM10008025_37770 [Ornithinibacillus halotolerans]
MYKLNTSTNKLEEVKETTFFENDIKERQHIEEWIRHKPEVLGEDLLIIGHEYDKFEVNERLDLLAVDREGNLVIIEVKRDYTGSQVEFQALKYASYCARLSPQDILEIYMEYLIRFGYEIEAKEELIEFLNVDNEEELNAVLNNSQRIIIVGNEIDKRILSVCTWLYENDLDIKCITMKPYKLDDDILVDINQIIPPYKLEDYYIKKKIPNNRRINVDKNISDFLQGVSSFINSQTDYTANYGGKRDYFVGHQFLNMPWRFVFAYKKKENTASMFIESYNPEIAQLIKEIGENYHSNLEKLLGCDISLTPGSRNKDLMRLTATLNLENYQSIEECLEKFNSTFVKFKKFLKDIINEN